MTPEQASDLPDGRHVTGVYVGTDTSYAGAVLKFRLRSQDTECACLRAAHVLATIDALDEWSRHHPMLDCGNPDASEAVRNAPADIFDNAPALVASDWDVRGKMATPFLHLLNNAVTLVLRFSPIDERGFVLSPGVIWVLRSVLVPNRDGFLEVTRGSIVSAGHAGSRRH